MATISNLKCPKCGAYSAHDSNLLFRGMATCKKCKAPYPSKFVDNVKNEMRTFDKYLSRDSFTHDNIRIEKRG